MTEYSQAELSERELEILRLVATGASNKEIAYTLSISANTVKVHLRNIFGKIGAASRTEAAMYAVKAGLAPAGEAGFVPAGEANVNAGVENIGASADGLRRAESVSASTAERREGNAKARLPRAWLVAGGTAGVLLLLIGLVLWRSANASRPAAMATSGAVQSAQVSLERWKAMADMPTARAGLAAAAYDGKIYAIAGEAQAGPTGAVELYDPLGNAWQVRTAKPIPVADVGAVTVGGRIYVPGGRTAADTITSTLEIYDPIADAWSRGPSLPVALSAYAITAYEGELYVFGGWDGKAYVDSVYTYKPGDASWATGTSMAVSCGYPAAAAIRQKIHVVGCFDGAQVSFAHWVYDPVLDHAQSSPWQAAVPLPTEEGRAMFSMQSVADSLYVFGGHGDGANALTFALTYESQGGQWQPVISPDIESRKGMGLVAEGNFLYAFGGMTQGGPTGQHWSYQAIYTLSVPVFIGP
ncbi:MAG: Kelch repeat-containing protein [Chloroflexota bacterium]